MRRHLITGLTAALAMGAAIAVPAIGQSTGTTGATGATGATGTTGTTPTTPGVPSTDRTAPEVSVAFSSTQLEERLLNEGVDFGLAADESVRIRAELAIGARTFSAGEVVAGGDSEITDGPGKRLVELRLTERGKAIIRRDGTEQLVLKVEVTDGAGNRASVPDRLSRTQRLQARLDG